MNGWSDFLDGFLITDIMVQTILVALRLPKTGPKAPSHYLENRKRCKVWSRVSHRRELEFQESKHGEFK